MSALGTSQLVKRRSFFHFWFPWIGIALGLIATECLWIWPFDQLERAGRVSGTGMIAVLTALLLAIWLLAFSGLRWWVRVGTLLLVVGAGGASIAEVGFTGDMVPLVRFRWNRNQDDILEAHRQRQRRAAGEVLLGASDPKPTDFPEYRGRLRDGVVHGPPLTRDWQSQPPRLVWQQPVGGGYAAFAIAGSLAVTIEQRRDDEAVVCYDATTGQERWLHRYPAQFKEKLGGPGPRATPTIAGGNVYSLGVAGKLVCLDLTSGKQKWSVDILHDNDNLQWGMSGSPLVYDQYVVVNPGAQRSTAAGRALVAYDRATGTPMWTGGDTKAGYSSPMLANLAGKRQILLFDGEMVAGYDPQTGDRLWRFPCEAYQGINVAQPVVLEGDRVLISAGYNIGSTMLRVSGSRGKWSVEQLWKNINMRCKFTSPVVYQGFLYGLDDGILVCLDEKTGERQWKDGRYGHGQLLLADDLLLILSEDGKLVLVEATPEGHRELASMKALEGEKTWNTPALAEGKVYLRNHMQMACYDLAAKGEE